MSELDALMKVLRERAGDACELCAGTDQLAPHPVPPAPEGGADRSVLACGGCRSQLAAETLDAHHWFCLQGSAWSEVPAVQVQSWRLLQRLAAEGWARDLAEQLYLPEDVLAWAQQGEGVSADVDPPTLDCNGARLSDGDSVTLIKDLDVKGTTFIAKRGTLVKNIRLTGDPAHVDGRVNKVAIVLKTCFLKKVS